MNAFANALFTLLFGWIRSGVQILWNASTQGHLSGFFTWLGDHWLLVAVFLCLVCTVMDYLVWLVRWRPYLVWRTKMRRFFAALRGRTWTDSRQFDRGYEAGVQMEMDGLVPPEPIPEPPVYSPEEPEVYAPVIFRRPLRAARRARLDEIRADADSEIGDEAVLRIARAVRDDDAIPRRPRRSFPLFLPTTFQPPGMKGSAFVTGGAKNTAIPSRAAAGMNDA